MEVLGLIILGLVQGLCEFLPVSSSGHLVFFSKIFGISDNLFVSIILHTATLLSICVVLRKEVFSLVKNPFSKQGKDIMIATIPTCLIVILLMGLVNESFEGKFLGVSFLCSAILLVLGEIVAKRNKSKINFPLSTRQCLIMGIAQGIAVFPGLSRSGTTISAGIMANGNKEECAKFSFLMSIPVVILSLLLEIYKICFLSQPLGQINVLGLIVAFILAFVTGAISIKFMIKLSSQANFKWFALYLVFMSILSFCVL